MSSRRRSSRRDEESSRDREKDKDRSDSRKERHTDKIREDEIMEDTQKDNIISEKMDIENLNQNNSKKEPLSLEELLKKREEKEKEEHKVVFLTKVQREQLAIERRNAQVNAMRARIEEERKAIQATVESGGSRDSFAEAREREYKESKDRSDRPDRDHDLYHDRDRERSDRNDRDHDRDRDRDKDSRSDRSDKDRDRDRDKDSRSDRRRDNKDDRRGSEREEQKYHREKEKEMAAIRAQYLGTKKEKKKPVKPSEKFKFSFDWELSDDTSRDLNPLYNNPHEAMLMYGRGLRAGIDPEEQKKTI